LFNHRSLGKVAVFIDDDPLKQNLKILGIPVEGPIEKLSEIISYYELDKIVIAMPSATGNILRKVTNECMKSGIEVLTVPSLSEIIDNKITFQQIRRVQVEDLLRREPVKTDILKVREFIRGKNVLVTGAGGSIGSELCRQILSFCPEKLILLGHGENSIFDIEHKLNFKLRFLKEKEKPKIISKISDIRFREYLSEVFRETKPEIVFHAAAHKHVPLMENNPGEAILNNILGTKNLVELAVEHNVSEFVLISTDKAVNPTNIMGTTKRIAEIMTLTSAKEHNKCFSAVRFGNVLGSRGSVLQTFRKQVLTGGPISITHPNIMRYFMTIPEAVQLVLQASVLCKGGEIFVLDMGDPVKIVDLARDFIKLSGLKEGIDVDIEFGGLRPGEKLFEELFIKGENYIRTGHEKILIASNASNILVNGIEQKIEKLVTETKVIDREKIYDLLKSIVPEYTPSYYYNNHI
jgi:FlaA1/EpsC-like NDP-sugar epimerase